MTLGSAGRTARATVLGFIRLGGPQAHGHSLWSRLRLRFMRLGALECTGAGPGGHPVRERSLDPSDANHLRQLPSATVAAAAVATAAGAVRAAAGAAGTATKAARTASIASDAHTTTPDAGSRHTRR